MDHQPGYHVAATGTEAVRFLVLWTAGWINSRRLEVIAFLREENRVLREQIGGRRRLGEFAGLVTPRHDPALVPRLIARKYDGSACPRAGRGPWRTGGLTREVEFDQAHAGEIRGGTAADTRAWTSIKETAPRPATDTPARPPCHREACVSDLDQFVAGTAEGEQLAAARQPPQ